VTRTILEINSLRNGAALTRTNIKDPDETKDNLLRGKQSPGAVAYTRYCATCHQPMGQGDGNRYPPCLDPIGFMVQRKD
jgi:mono/diheme cytochrome c family protein